MGLGDHNVPWPEVKKLCSAMDIDRLACLAVAAINSGTIDQSAYTKAANQFGGNIKPESYKRGLWVISKRIKDAQASGQLGDGTSPAKGTPTKGAKQGAWGEKRKAGEDSDQDDEEVRTPKRAKKGTTKVVKKEEKDVAIAHSPAQAETAGDDLDQYFQ